MKKNESENHRVILEEVTAISPHNKALYEAGKTLLIQSVEVGREFCKFMTTTTLSAIPIYLALLKLVLPKDYSLHNYDEIIFLVPALVFLISAVFFVIGYFPQKGKISLDLPDEIEKDRSNTINRRYRFAIIAFTIFCIGIVIASLILVSRLIN